MKLLIVAQMALYTTTMKIHRCLLLPTILLCVCHAFFLFLWVGTIDYNLNGLIEKSNLTLQVKYNENETDIYFSDEKKI